MSGFFNIPVLPDVPLVVRTVQENNIQTLNSLIKEGVDVNAVDENGFTALHYEAERGQNEMIQELLLAGADRTIVSEFMQLTALSLAIVNQHKNCILSLVSEKFIIGMNDGNNEETREFLRFVVNQPHEEKRLVPLSVACVYFPAVDVLLELLKAGAQLTDCYTSDGLLPIHCASFFCSREVVELLLEWGANPESLTIGNTLESAPSPLKRIGSSLTPLACASWASNKEAFKALVRAGADPNTCISPSNIHPLQIVCLNLDDEFREKSSELFIPHVMSTKEETIEMLTFMLLECPDVKIDHQNAEGDTALHIASKTGCKKGVEMLLNAEADPSLKNLEGKTPAEVTLDPTVRTLLEAYQGDNSARVVRGRSNASLTQSPVQAIGFTRRKQCLVTSKGAFIEPGPSIIDQPEGGNSKDQSSGISLTIPGNSLSETVAVTLNYTPNPPVLHQQKKEMKRPESFQSPQTKSDEVPSLESKMNQREQTGQCESEIVQFSSPVTDFSRQAKETVISPFVTITASQPVTLSKQGHVTFSHCAKSNQDLSQTKTVKRQFAITIKEQSLTEDGHITDWKTIHKNKVKCTDDEATVLIDKLEQASTYVAVAASTTGKPIREVMKKRMDLWILGNPKLERQMHVTAVCCTNAYRPAKIVGQLQEDSLLKLQPWHPVPYPVITQNDIKVAMSTSEEGWEFGPTSHLVENDVVSSLGVIFPYVFCLECKKRELQKIRCNCCLEFDGNERKLAFYTSDRAGRKEEERLSDGGLVESGNVLDLGKSLFDLEEGIRVVARFCSDKWLLFGVALGYNQSEVKSFGHLADDPEGKLELVIRSWMDDKGKKATVGALLDVCDQFHKRGRVEQELKKILGISDMTRQSMKDTQIDVTDESCCDTKSCCCAIL